MQICKVSPLIWQRICWIKGDDAVWSELAVFPPPSAWRVDTWSWLIIQKGSWKLHSADNRLGHFSKQKVGSLQFGALMASESLCGLRPTVAFVCISCFPGSYKHRLAWEVCLFVSLTFATLVRRPQMNIRKRPHWMPERVTGPAPKLILESPVSRYRCVSWVAASGGNLE